MNLLRFAPLRLALAVSAANLAAVAVAAPARPVPQPAIIALPLNPVVPAAQRSCTATLPSGLGHSALKPGTGAKPATTDYVLVNYIGYLAADGTVFDQGMQAAFPVSGVIPGFGEGLTLMQRGGIMRLCIPAALGYGAGGSGPIPANAALVFQVELVDFRTAVEIDAAQRAAAAAAAKPAPADPAPKQ